LIDALVNIKGNVYFSLEHRQGAVSIPIWKDTKQGPDMITAGLKVTFQQNLMVLPKNDM